METIRAHPVLAAVAVLTVLAGAIVVGFALRRDDDNPFQPKTPDIAPAEYLYLDNERVGSYLSQVENGLSAEEKRGLKDIRSVSTEAGLQGVKLGGSLGRERTLEQTVTPTDNSRFYRLLTLLNDESLKVQGKPLLTRLDARQPMDTLRKQLANVRQGGFIEIDNAEITRPPYVLAYYGLKQAVSDRSLVRLDFKLRDLPSAREFARRVGENPRFPMVVRAGFAPPGYARPAQDRLNETAVRLPNERKYRGIKFLLTSKFSNFAPESNLFRTELTVVGKVIAKPVPGAPGGRTDIRSKYVDEESVSTFAPALRRAPPQVQRLLGVKRGQIEPNLEKQLSIRSPGLVILPIAIFS